MNDDPGSGRQESEEERVDRNLRELLEELRVALPGVQVLFAFLLVVPFNQRFAEVTQFQVKLYLGVLLCAAAASAFLIAPSVQHRITFRHQDKEHLVLVANRLAIIGLTFLAVAMIGAVVLVTDYLFASRTTIVAGIATAVLFAVFWYLLPIRRRLQLSR